MRESFLAAVALGATIAGCGGGTPKPQGPDLPPPASNDVYALYARDMAELDSVKAQVSGRVQQLFLIKKADDGFSWGKPCQNFNVIYRWQPSRHLNTYDLRNNTDVAAHLPFHTGLDFKGYFDQGQVVRIRVASRGSWNLDTTSLRVPRECAVGATHYVKTISVGAFLVTTLSSASAGASASMLNQELARMDTGQEKQTGMEAGKVFDCEQGDDSGGPPEGCKEPVQIMVGPLSDLPQADDSWAKPGEGEAKPTADTAPQPEATCYEAPKRTGDPQADIVAIGAACKQFGLTPMGQPIVQRPLSADQGWQRQFELQLEQGVCYRFFAVGDSGIEDLDIGIKDSTDQQIAVDGQRGPVAVINADGAFCAKKTETAVLLAKVEKGAGRYAFWQFKKAH
jgi:hypothetical protein